MDGNQLSVNFLPLVACAEPCLDDVQRPCIFAHAQTIGIVLAVSVRIAVGKLIHHVINIFDGLRLFQTQLLSPVRTVAQPVTSDGPGTVNAYQLTVHGKCLTYIFIHLGKVGVFFLIPYKIIQIPERAVLGRLYDIGSQVASVGDYHGHIRFVHQGNAQDIAVRIVGYPVEINIDSRIILGCLQHVFGTNIPHGFSIDINAHESDSRIFCAFRRSAFRSARFLGSGLRSFRCLSAARFSLAAAACKHGNRHRAH